MNQEPRCPFHLHVDGLSFPPILVRLFWSGDVVQFSPCSLDLANKIWDGISFLFPKDPAFTSAINGSTFQAHLTPLPDTVVYAHISVVDGHRTGLPVTES